MLHDFIVLGIVSEGQPDTEKGTSRQRSGKGAIRNRFPLQMQKEMLPRPIERAEVKFSFSDTFSFIFTMVSNHFVPGCFFFSKPTSNRSFRTHFLFISYPITTIPHQGNFVTTFIISALAILVLNGRFVTNFVILYLGGSMKSFGHLVHMLFRICKL